MLIPISYHDSTFSPCGEAGSGHVVRSQQTAQLLSSMMPLQGACFESRHASAYSSRHNRRPNIVPIVIGDVRSRCENSSRPVGCAWPGVHPQHIESPRLSSAARGSRADKAVLPARVFFRTCCCLRFRTRHGDSMRTESCVRSST